MQVTCPSCREVTTWEENKHRPFCSERCRLIDLGTWASGGYAIAGEPTMEHPGMDPSDGDG